MKLKTIYLPLIGGLALACQAAGETDAPGVKANEATKTETVDAAGDEETTPATETIPVYVVKSAGGGWGAAKRVREALMSQDGVKDLMLSGLRATVFMEEGKKLEEEAVKTALKEKGMTFKGMTAKKMPKPKAEFVLAVTGNTWAITNDKARAALEKMDGVAAVYVDKVVKIHLTEDKELDEEVVKSTLKGFKMNTKSVKKSDSLPF